MEDLSWLDVGAYVGVAVGAATVASYMMRPTAPKYGFDYRNQTTIQPGGERIRRLAKFSTELISKFDSSETLYEVFEHGVSLNGASNYIGYRESEDSGYTWISYAEAKKIAVNMGAGLVGLGLEAGNTRVGIFSQNRPEWVLAEKACYYHNMVVVPLYDTLGDEAVQYIINQAELKVIVCESNKVEKVLDAAPKCLNLKFIVVIGEITPEQMADAATFDITMRTFDQVVQSGSVTPVKATKPKADDWATICYTSGTTGMPKGAILTHRNLVADASAVNAVIEGAVEIGPEDVHISYLPLAHMFERVVQVLITQKGGSIGFFRGDVKTLLDDIKALQPTLFPSVPRLLNKVYDKVMSGVDGAGGIKKALFNWAFSSKSAEVNRGVVRRDSIWDRLVFHKIQATLGGRVRLLITGAAPIHPRVLHFLRVSLGCYVAEGYGQTESSAGATLTLPGDVTPGHVGSPLPCNEIKLADIPDMNYYSKDDRGEICFRGPNVFVGYLNNEEKTKETIDEDGWLHSGDVGEWTSDGSLRIIDRKKHIFKLAQGEYIAPEKIENVYMQHPAVAQCYVHGESLKSSLVAVVFPDEEPFMAWAAAKSIEGTFEELCNNLAVITAILKEMTDVGKKGGLKSFEQAKACTLKSELMSVENGLLTPTFKSKRPVLKTHFAADIDSLYTQIGQ